MSGPDITSEVPQPDSFEFSPENQEKIAKIIAKYPEGRQASAIMPLLDLAQRQNDNWVPTAAMDKIAEIVGVAPIRVYEVATFYTMYNKKPVGKWFLQLCRTTPCWLRGCEDLKSVIREELGIDHGETTSDGMFSLLEVECLGACVNAPVVQVNDDYYEDLDASKLRTLLESLKKGEQPPFGSMSGRTCSAPEGMTAPKTV